MVNSKRNRPGHKAATSDCRTYLWQLSFRNPISVENNARGLKPGGFVELNEQLSHHVGQILDDLLPGPLDAHSGAVPAGMSIHTADHLENSMLKGSVTAVGGKIQYMYTLEMDHMALLPKADGFISKLQSNVHHCLVI